MKPGRSACLLAGCLLVVCLTVSPALAWNERIPTSVSGSYLSFNYTQKTPNGLDQHGELAGVRTRHSWGFGPRWVGTLETYLAGGRTDNQGITFTGLIDDTSTHGMVKLQWNMGYAFDRPGYSIVPHSGLGIRGWRDEIEGVNGYDKTTTWSYLPVGVYLIGEPNRDEGRGPVFKLEYRELIDGNVRHDLEPLGRGSVDTDQDDGHGFNLTASAYVHPRVQIQGYYSFWNLDPSESKTVGGLTVQEPRNETTMIGGSVGYVF